MRTLELIKLNAWDQIYESTSEQDSHIHTQKLHHLHIWSTLIVCWCVSFFNYARYIHQNLSAIFYFSLFVMWAVNLESSVLLKNSLTQIWASTAENYFRVKIRGGAVEKERRKEGNLREARSTLIGERWADKKVGEEFLISSEKEKVGKKEGTMCALSFSYPSPLPKEMHSPSSDHAFNQLFRQKTKVCTQPWIMEGEKAERRVEVRNRSIHWQEVSLTQIPSYDRQLRACSGQATEE